eukprot:gene11080-14875_t
MESHFLDIDIDIMKISTFQLMNGVQIPKVGLGTYKMTKDELDIAIPIALDCGYRLFDTAAGYKNECFIGSILERELLLRGWPRSSVFVTTKLRPVDLGYEKSKLAIEASIESLGQFGFPIDLVLIHWPGASKVSPTDPINFSLRSGSWNALQEAYESNKIRAIGVSNYTIKHLELMKNDINYRIAPMVNQYEFHLTHYPLELLKYCQTNNIHFQSYSSLGCGYLVSDEFMNSNNFFGSIIQRLQSKFPEFKITAAMVCLTWILQKGISIIPKSINPIRIHQNNILLLFENLKLDNSDNISIDNILTVEEINALDNIHQEMERVKICWDPNVVD